MKLDKEKVFQKIRNICSENKHDCSDCPFSEDTGYDEDGNPDCECMFELDVVPTGYGSLANKIMKVEEHFQFYMQDVKKISQAIFNHYGIQASFEEVYDLWADISESYCAGWLIVPDNEKEIIDAIKSNIL